MTNNLFIFLAPLPHFIKDIFINQNYFSANISNTPGVPSLFGRYIRRYARAQNYSS